MEHGEPRHEHRAFGGLALVHAKIVPPQLVVVARAGVHPGVADEQLPDLGPVAAALVHLQRLRDPPVHLVPDPGVFRAGFQLVLPQRLPGPLPQSVEEHRAQAVAFALQKQEVPGFGRLLQVNRSLTAGGDELCQGEGKFVHHADLHEEFQQLAVPFHHHMICKVSGKGVVNFLLHLRPGSHTLGHLQCRVAHRIGIALGVLR